MVEDFHPEQIQDVLRNWHHPINQRRTTPLTTKAMKNSSFTSGLFISPHFEVHPAVIYSSSSQPPLPHYRCHRFYPVCTPTI